jgi:hypothetical protein
MILSRSEWETINEHRSKQDSQHDAELGDGVGNLFFPV